MAAETMRITEEIVVNDKTGPGLDSASKKVSAFDQTVQRTQQRLDKMSGSRWSVAFGAVDKATSVITKVESKIHTAVGKAWNFTVGLVDKATAPLQGIFNLLRNPLLQAGAVLGITVSVSDAISTFGGFESTMSKVQAISGASAEDMADLTALAKEMGATTKFTAQEAAEGLTYMAMAGWKTEDMMTSLAGVMNLAAASGEDLATVSDIVTDAMTAFGLAADGVTASGVSNATHFADVLAAASSNANTNVSMMGETFKYVGSMAGAMGYSIEDVALATGLMANSGIKGTMAGTALNSMLTRLSTNSSGAADAIKALGVEYYNADGSARSLGDVLGELRRATVGMTAAQKSELANTVAGMEAQKGLLAILNTSEEDYRKLSDAIYDADGAAQKMSDTMLDNMQGSMTLLQSAVDGVKLSLGSRLSPYVKQFAEWLTTKMPAVETVINDVMDSIDGKIAGLKATIEEFTGSDEWANADVWGKISIAWDKIVAEPFAAWWDSTGKPWLTEKVGAFGETLGSGITSGLLAILGFDASGAVEDGKTIGSSFIEGFRSGFDTDKIGEALKEWAEDHKGVVAAAGLVAGGKLIGGIAKAFQTGKNVLGDLRGLFGGSKDNGVAGAARDIFGGAHYATSTMTVTAGTVIVNGSMGNATNAASSAVKALSGGSLPAAGGAAGLPAATAPLGLPGATAAAGAGSALPTVELANGSFAVASGGLQAGLANVGVTLGSGATTAAGAAAVGAGSIAGIIGGLLGLGSAGVDVYQGVQKAKEGDAKGAKDEYVTAGTKASMVGAGAAAGAAIGSVIPVLGTGIGALVGAGIGGVGALLGGNKAGKAISDSTEEGGFLNEAGKAIGGFFTETIPGFVTETIPSVASDVGTAVSEFATGVGEAVGGFFTETVPGFLTETVPYAAGYVFGAAETFFGQTVPTFFSNLWTDVGTFFAETVPTWAEGVYNKVTGFFTQTVPEFFSNMWGSVHTFMTETLPTWATGVYNKAATFFGETVPAFFTDLWTDVTGFVTETIPEWATGVYNGAVGFFTETVPGFFSDLWGDISGFVTETIPAWGASIGRTVSGWWSSVSGWFGDIWDDVSSAFSSGRSAGAAAGAHAEGGIMNAPHMALVAEDGPEAIVPLGSGSRARGLAVWEQAGDILGVGSNDTGVNTQPVGSRDDGIGGFAPQEAGNGNQGGRNAEGGPVYTPTTPGATAAQETATEAQISAPVSIVLSPEFVIQSTEGMNEEAIVDVIKRRIRELVDDIGDEMAERLAKTFANMPLRGGA